MSIKEFLRYAVDILKNAGIETPVLEAGVVLCHVLKCDRVYLYSHDDRVLEKAELEALDHMLLRRANNVPMQYLVGQTEFMSLPFVVSPAVLIPRQDTEVLAEKCIELVKELGRLKQGQGAGSAEVNISAGDNINEIYAGSQADKNRVKVLDMCTGSGCIGISIAHFCLECYVVACDVSQEALNVAKTNSERNETQNRLELRCGNLFEALEAGQRFDIIASNPPYIETETIPALQKEVGYYEPKLALDGGSDGLCFYRRIVKEAPNYLINGGYLAFEIGYNQGQSVKALMQSNFKEVAILKDINRNDRVVLGKLI